MNYPQRMYSKTELGLLYFPDTTDGATARRHIMDWIKRCEPLWNELQRLGYQNRSQYFLPRRAMADRRRWAEPTSIPISYGPNEGESSSMTSPSDTGNSLKGKKVKR